MTAFYPLYGACEELENYILICSESSAQANKYLANIARELAGNPALADKYPDACGEGPIWNQSTLVLRNGVTIEALGAGKKVRGRRMGEKRPTCIIVDDPEGEDAVFSKVRRGRIYDWFTRGVLPAGDQRTNFFVIGTRLHQECLTAQLSRQGWEHKVFKAISEWPARMDLWNQWELALSDQSLPDVDARKAAARAYYETNKDEMERGAKLLWPEREPLYTLMLQRAVDGHSPFEAEKQNNPIDPSKTEWDSRLLEANPLDPSTFYFDDWPADVQVKAMALDPSKGAHDDSGDYSAIVKVAQAGELVYVEADVRRRDTTQIVIDFLEHARAFKPDLAGIEANAFQFLLAGEVWRQSTQDKGSLVPVVPIDNTVRKAVRIRRIGPFLNIRALRFKSRSPGTELLLDQLRQFPHASYDDAPDALEMALRLLGQVAEDTEREETQKQGAMQIPQVELYSQADVAAMAMSV